MNIAIETSPLSGPHGRRGIGWYTNNLILALNKYENKHSYVLFNRTEKLPNNIDIIHYPFFDPFFLTLPPTHNKRSVVTIHDLIPLLYPDKIKPGIKGGLIWHIQKRKARNYGAIITDSGTSRKDIMEIIRVPSEKVHVVHLAAGEEFQIINDKRALIKIVKKYNLNKFLMYVGDVNFNKNIHSLMQSFQKVSHDYPDLDLALVGDGFLGSSREARDIDVLISNLELTHKVKRLGFVPTEDLVGLYNCAKVYIQPSFYEGFGLPVLEAMACGCTVVASRGGSLSEIMGETGITIDPENIGSIRDGIVKALELNTVERKELVNRELLQASRFSWRETAKQTVKVYESLL